MRKAARAIIILDNNLLVMHRNKFGHEYYTLVGGGVDVGETPEDTLVREVTEETSLRLTQFRHVFIEHADEVFGDQYIYLCEFPGGTVALPDDSDEAQINQLGKNLYTPMWLPLDKLPTVEFLSERLKQAILDGIKNGWPETPRELN